MLCPWSGNEKNETRQRYNNTNIMRARNNYKHTLTQTHSILRVSRPLTFLIGILNDLYRIGLWKHKSLFKGWKLKNGHTHSLIGISPMMFISGLDSTTFGELKKKWLHANRGEGASFFFAHSKHESTDLKPIFWAPTLTNSPLCCGTWSCFSLSL